MPTVLLGDSLTVGTGARYRLLDPNARVEAKVGARIEWMVSRVPFIDPGSLVFVMAGTNNLMSEPARAVANTLQLLVNELHRHNCTVYVGTLPPLKGRETERLAYNARMEFDARSGAYALAHIADDMPAAMMSADGVHPTIAGYDRMAKRWFEIASRQTSSATSRIPVLGAGVALGLAIWWARDR